MRYTGILAAVAACTMVACTGLPAAGGFWTSKAYADGSRATKYRAKRAVRVRGFLVRGGYYSYSDPDAINSYAWNRSLFTSSSIFRTPLSDQQSPAGPFDSGFFFDSGLGPRFNDAPYPR
jgi:hypothetical protein